MLQEQDIWPHLPGYRRLFIENVSPDPAGDLVITSRIPRSVACPSLEHASPADLLLVVMQASFLAAGLSVENIPVEYRERGVLLSHQTRYLNQNASMLKGVYHIQQTRRESMDVMRMHVTEEGVLQKRLLYTILPKEAIQPVIEDQSPDSSGISRDQIAEVLSIYDGESNADVDGISFDSGNQMYRAVISFPRYYEYPDSDHATAKQMMEGVMKAAFCAAADEAYQGNLPISYEEFLKRRLDVRTDRSDLRHRKFVNMGSHSPLFFHLDVKGNTARVSLVNRSDAPEERSFVTGSMDFYLPAA